MCCHMLRKKSLKSLHTSMKVNNETKNLIIILNAFFSEQMFHNLHIFKMLQTLYVLLKLDN